MKNRRQCGHSSSTHLPLDKMAASLTDNIFKCIFMNEKFCILIGISLKFVPKGSINNIPALVKIMAWRRIGDKPLCEPMLTCSTRGRWVKWQHHRKPRDKVSKVLYSLYEEQTAMWASFINSSPPGQNGRRFGRQHFQMHFHERKGFVFWLEFHWSLFLRVQLTIFQHWLR